DDIIVACRLMNIFRRKGVRLLTLSMVEAPDGFCIMAMVEAPESEWEHHYHFIRRTEGVRHVTWYRDEPSGTAAQYVFINLERGGARNGHWADVLPGGRVVLACQGKALLEAPPGSDLRAHPIPGAHYLSPVRSTRDTPVRQPKAFS
ncbi:MAG: hypothetical protein ACRD2G_08320, partial [Terriglobia bacterium]